MKSMWALLLRSRKVIKDQRAVREKNSMHLASKVDRSSALIPPSSWSFKSVPPKAAHLPHIANILDYENIVVMIFLYLRHLNCTAVWDCKNLQELREIGAEQGGEVNVLRFDQPWPLLLTISNSLYTYVYTYKLYILYLHFIRGRVLLFD